MSSYCCLQFPVHYHMHYSNLLACYQPSIYLIFQFQNICIAVSEFITCIHGGEKSLREQCLCAVIFSFSLTDFTLLQNYLGQILFFIPFSEVVILSVTQFKCSATFCIPSYSIRWFPITLFSSSKLISEVEISITLIL